MIRLIELVGVIDTVVVGVMLGVRVGVIVGDNETVVVGVGERVVVMVGVGEATAELLLGEGVLVGYGEFVAVGAGVPVREGVLEGVTVGVGETVAEGVNVTDLVTEGVGGTVGETATAESEHPSHSLSFTTSPLAAGRIAGSAPGLIIIGFTLLVIHQFQNSILKCPVLRHGRYPAY